MSADLEIRSRKTLIRLDLLVFVLLLAPGACAQPAAPSGLQVVRPPCLLLSGQSNAVLVAPAVARLVCVLTVARDATGIAAWAPGGPLWTALARQLPVLPFRAFVWWQGESDEGDLTGYRAAVLDLLARVRLGAGAPRLPVVIVGANSYDAPGQADLRALQADLAASVPRAVFVSTVDLPIAAGWHLTPDAYDVAAARIVAAATGF